MARAPDAPNVTGGQLDPYVSQSLQQGQQQSSNRLITAMQQQGETQRAGMQTASAEKQQAMAGQQAIQKQAADLAMRDKEMAAEIASKGEDRKHTEMLQTQNQGFLAKQSELLREAELADQGHDDARAEKAYRRLMALEGARGAAALASARESAKVMLSAVDLSQMQESAMATYDDGLTSSAEKAEQDKIVHDGQIELSKNSILANRNFDISNISPESEKLSLGAKMYLGAKVALGGTLSRGYPILGAVQERVTANGSKVDITALSSSDAHKIKDGIARGEIDYMDVRKAIAGLDGGMLAVDEKIKESSMESDKKAWGREKVRLGLRRSTLMGLGGETGTKIAGDQTGKTVAHVIREATGSISGSTVSSEIALRKVLMGDMRKATASVKEGLRKKMEYSDPYAYPPNATPEDVEAYDFLNKMKLSVFPSAGSITPVVPARKLTLDQLDTRGIEGL